MFKIREVTTKPVLIHFSKIKHPIGISSVMIILLFHNCFHKVRRIPEREREKKKKEKEKEKEKGKTFLMQEGKAVRPQNKIVRRPFPVKKKKLKN